MYSALLKNQKNVCLLCRHFLGDTVEFPCGNTKSPKYQKRIPAENIPYGCTFVELSDETRAGLAFLREIS